MKTIAPVLCYSPRRRRATEAWFVPGSDPEIWLREISGWRVEHSRLQLLCVPRSLDQRAPVGVLAILPAESAVDATWVCHAYGRVAPNLYVPVESFFDPEPTEEEWGRLLVAAAVYIWHPASGLVRFDSEDIHPVCELFAPPVFCDRTWNRALPGVRFPDKLLSLTPQSSPAAHDVIVQGREDIGAGAGDLSSLPPTPNERSPGVLEEAAGAFRGWIARWVLRMSEDGPTANRPSWLDRWRSWAEDVVTQDQFESQRQKEIERLQHLLDADPDEGLRYALPLAGGPGRGVAPPSGRLNPRSTDFDVHHLGEAGPVEVWNISLSQHLALVAKYRQLANRELTLGRYRRAAYILGELLGDWNAAVQALIQGRHYRDAAVLLRDKLSATGRAAACLEQGGLLDEAIELYRSVDEFEKAGDVYRRLHREAEAREMYRLEVDKQLQRSNRIAAAALLEQKLDAPEEAARALTETWPKLDRPDQSVEMLFSILGRAGLHEESKRWLNRIKEDRIPAYIAAPVAPVLAAQSEQYPDAGIRSLARDAAMSLVAENLKYSPAGEQRLLLAALKKLAPHDRLLDRDCERFLEEQERRPTIRPTIRLRGLTKLKPAVQFDIPGRVTWHAAAVARNGQTYYLAGVQDGRLRIARFNYLGQAEVTPPLFLVPPFPPNFQFMARILGRGEEMLGAFPYRAPARNFQVFAATAQFPVRAVLDDFAGIGPDVVAVAEEHGYWTLSLTGGVPMVAGPADAGFVAPFNFSDGHELRFYVRKQTPYIGHNDTLYVYHRGDVSKSYEMADVIRQITGIGPLMRTRIAVALPVGGVMIWDDPETQLVCNFAADLRDPVMTFSQTGTFFCASRDGCHLYSTKQQLPELIGEGPGDEQTPIAVLSSYHPGVFAVCHDGGKVKIFNA